MGFTPIPVNTHTICCYAAFLTRSLQFSSINNYLGIIALLHKEFGLPNSLVDNWVLKSLLLGFNPIRPGGGSEARMAKLIAANQKPLILLCPNLVTFSFYP